MWACRQLLLLAALLMIARPARGHDPFEITSVGRIRADSLEVVVTMTRSTALTLMKREDGGRPFKPEEFAAYQPALQALSSTLFDVRSLGYPVALRSAETRLSPENEVEFRLVYARPGPGSLKLHALHFGKLPDHINALTLSQDSPPGVLGIKLLRAEDPALEATVAGAIGTERRLDSVAPRPSLGFWAFLVLGVEHIVTGYDHLLFLAALLIACAHLRAMLVLVTAFTVAHSITLVCSALDLFSLPDRIVEPLIAASIVFIGVENVLSRAEPKYRYVPSFAFGLIHGFGFAAVLKELGLGEAGAPLAAPLFAFNVGVELGQLMIGLVALPLILKLRERGPFGRPRVQAVSIIVSLVGVYWLLQRTLSG